GRPAQQRHLRRAGSRLRHRPRLQVPQRGRLQRLPRVVDPVDRSGGRPVTKASARDGLVATLALLLALGAGAGVGGEGGSQVEADSDAGAEEEKDEWDKALDERVVDYSAALRVAALRLTVELPTRAEIKAVAEASDESARRQIYVSLVQSYLDSPLFARQMVLWWRDTLKVGGSAELDAAAAFAAQVTVEDRPLSDLFTATSGTCPTFDPETGTFTPADCDNGVPQHAGLLTHP